MIDHEERISAALRAVSDDVSTRPTLVADVLAGARRRHRRRVAGVAAGTVAVAVAASAVAAGGLRSLAGSENSAGTPTASTSTGTAVPTSCQVERLPVPDRHRSLVSGGDPTGRFLVGRAYAGTGYVEKHPLLIWDDGRLTTVDMPGFDESFKDINSSGVAVGSSFNGGELRDGQSAYVYRDGKLTRLQATTNFAVARAVGKDGTIVGAVGDDPDEVDRPVVWRDPAGPPQRLDLPAGFAAGIAVDVDTDGTIVGAVGRSPVADRQGYIWKPDGTHELLPMPEIDGKPAQAWGPDIVHNGVVSGSAQVRDAEMLRNVPLLFNLRTGRFTLLTHSYGGAGNTTGWLLVTANPPSVVAPTGRAVLPPLASSGGGTPVFISEDGLIVGGQSNDASGEMQAVRWRCR